MSFPSVIFGDYGDEKTAQSTKIGNLPLGMEMTLPDGRRFAHAQASAALGAGVIVGTIAGTVGHGNGSTFGLIASATATYNAVGDTTVRVACVSAAATLDQYADGFVNVQKSAGIGEVYRVKSNKVAASTGVELEIELYPQDALKTAWTAGSTTIALRKSPYKDATVYSTSAAVGPVMGVTPTAISANFYFWVQRKGPAGVRCAVIMTDGVPVVASSTVSGSAMPAISAYQVANLYGSQHIGKAMNACASTEAALVDLTLV